MYEHLCRESLLTMSRQCDRLERRQDIREAGLLPATAVYHAARGSARCQVDRGINAPPMIYSYTTFCEEPFLSPPIDRTNILSENETAVFKRGRNAHSGHSPKNQEAGDYRYATGLETLYGYLYLCGETKRIKEIFEASTYKYFNQETNRKETD